MDAVDSLLRYCGLPVFEGRSHVNGFPFDWYLLELAMVLEGTDLTAVYYLCCSKNIFD